MALFNKIKVGSEEYDTWSTYDLVEDIREEIINHVENPDTVTAIASEIASGKQVIASAINAKGGTADPLESFQQLADDVVNLNTSFITYGVEVSEKIHWLKFICDSSTVARLPLTVIDDDIVTSISQANALAGCSALESVKMTSLVIISSSSAFYNCSSLQQVNMPNLTAISGSHAFTYCSALQEVKMPNLVTLNSSNGFDSCTSLQQVNMPTLTTLSGNYVFQNCTSLQQVNMPTLTTLSSSYAFTYCSALQEVKMPNLATFSGGNVFLNCTALRNVIFGTIVSLAEPFYNAKPNLRNITIGANTNINLPFNQWTATNVIAEGQSGIDELNTNLYNNLLIKLYDHSQDGQTRTLRIGWLANVTQENIDYATSKGWTLTT